MQKVWSVVFGVVLFASLLLFVVSPMLRWWLPPDISTFGREVDGLYYLILYMTGFFFVLTEGLMVYFLWRYLYDPKRRAKYTHGNHKLEWFWTVVTSVLLVFIAVAQIRAWEKIKYQNSMPKPVHVFEVAARQFEWRIRYPAADTMAQIKHDWQDGEREPDSAKSWVRVGHADDVHVVNEVHTWKDANVRLYLKSRDVLHSFFLPNLRLKQDAVPGKTIPVWFKATEANIEWDGEHKEWKPLGAIWDATKNKEQGGWKPGWDDPEWSSKYRWELACAELCGWGHSKMQGRLFVHKDYQDYLEWLTQAQKNEQSRQPGTLDKPKSAE